MLKGLTICIVICIFVCLSISIWEPIIYVNICIYIYIERERDVDVCVYRYTRTYTVYKRSVMVLLSGTGRHLRRWLAAESPQFLLHADSGAPLPLLCTRPLQRTILLLLLLLLLLVQFVIVTK